MDASVTIDEVVEVANYLGLIDAKMDFLMDELAEKVGTLSFTKEEEIDLAVKISLNPNLRDLLRGNNQEIILLLNKFFGKVISHVAIASLSDPERALKLFEKIREVKGIELDYYDLNFTLNQLGEIKRKAEVQDKIMSIVCELKMLTYLSTNHITLEGFQKLPLSLVHLEISDSQESPKLDFTLLKTFPSLTRLRMNFKEVDKIKEALKHLPRLFPSLTNFRVECHQVESSEEILKTLPPTLTSLDLGLKRTKGTDFKHLSPHLIKLTLRNCSVSNKDLADLPPLIQSLNILERFSDKPEEEVKEVTVTDEGIKILTHAHPQLTSLMIDSRLLTGKMFENLPPTLTHLVLCHEAQIKPEDLKHFPSHVTHLTLEEIRNSQWFLNLPSTLTYLTAHYCVFTLQGIQSHLPRALKIFEETECQLDLYDGALSDYKNVNELFRRLQALRPQLHIRCLADSFDRAPQET